MTTEPSTDRNTSSDSLEQEFAESTTLHGLVRIYNATRILTRLVWVGILLTCLCVCVWQITDRFQKFFLYKANTEISIEFVSDLNFPAITICNFNRYLKDEITESDVHFLRYILDATDYDYDSYGESLDTISYRWDDGGPGNDSSAFNYTEFTLRAGFKMDENTLLGCEWRGKSNSCSVANFTHTFTSFGNCWTFNSGRDAPILKETQSGSRNGVAMLIDIQQDQYTETLAGNIEAGLKVLIHDQKTPPIVETAGLAIQPGVHAFVGTRKQQYGNLEKPYGKCKPGKTLTRYNEYTLEGCMIECRTLTVLDKCGCRLVRFPGTELECSPQQTTHCANGVLGQINRNENNLGCTCPIPCNYTTFTTTLSTAAIPNQAVAEELVSLYQGIYDHENSSNSLTDTHIRNNWIVLDVYFEEINFQKIVQSEAITPSALISDIGGQLGLFLGASLITLAEIMSYIGQKIQKLFQRNIKTDNDIHDLRNSMMLR